MVNRVTPPMPDQLRLGKVKPAGLQNKLRRNWRDFAALKERETASLRVLGEMLPAGVTMLSAPDLGREPRSLRDLADIAGIIESAGLSDRS